MNRAEVVVALEGIGDLLDAIALGVEDQHLEPATVRVRALEVGDQRLVALDAGVHDHELAHDVRRRVAGVLGLKELHFRRDFLAAGETFRAEDARRVGGEQQTLFQRLDDRSTHRALRIARGVLLQQGFRRLGGRGSTSIDRKSDLRIEAADRQK